MANQGINSNRTESLEAVRSHWKDKTIVEGYEQSRYGNIRRSLSHYLDCDAIDAFIKNNFGNEDILLLDLACGTARLTRTIFRQNRKIISMDYSENMLLDAKNKAERQSMPFYPVRADGFCLPFKTNSFNGIFTVRFIRHYKEAERRKIYAEIYRILKPTGILILDVLNSDIDKDAYNRPVYDETYTFQEITQELKENGFILQNRLAGNIVKNSLFVIFKKWSLTPLGRWYSKIIRSKKLHLDNASFWMVCAKRK